MEPYVGKKLCLREVFIFKRILHKNYEPFTTSWVKMCLRDAIFARCVWEPGSWMLLFYCRPNEIKNPISYKIGFSISYKIRFSISYEIGFSISYDIGFSILHEIGFSISYEIGFSISYEIGFFYRVFNKFLVSFL